MPTITSIALENLLEPRVRDSQKKSFRGGESDSRIGGPRHLYISPALYATPEQAPIPDHSSPDPNFPSPYVVNLKRRRGGNERRSSVQEPSSGNEADALSSDDAGENSAREELVGDDEVGEAGEEAFLDLKSETVSVGAEVETNDFSMNQFDCRSFTSAQGDFYDAIDDFSSDGSVSNIHSTDSRTESELNATRLSLLEETVKRKTAEENLVLMHSQWEKVRNIMSEAGLTFPAPPVARDGLQLENNLIDQIAQEVMVTRFVSEAIGRGQARAEAEEAASTIIDMKDQEISRLKDKLQYYETVNHEMSQRKLVDVARKQQERRRRRTGWIWTFMGLSIAIGASFVVYTYAPQAGGSRSLLESSDSTDVSSVSAPDTSK